MELRLTMAPDEDLPPPKHCLEEMVLVALPIMTELTTTCPQAGDKFGMNDRAAIPTGPRWPAPVDNP